MPRRAHGAVGGAGQLRCFGAVIHRSSHLRRCVCSSTPSGSSIQGCGVCPDYAPTRTGSPTAPKPPKPLCAAPGTASPTPGVGVGLERRLDELIALAVPTALSRLGCGTHSTAGRLIAAGENIDLLSSGASRPHRRAAAPVPAFSWCMKRHRLNFAGIRDASRAPPLIVIVRLRYCERTRSYMTRRRTEGETKRGKPFATTSALSPEARTAPCEPTSSPSQPAPDIYGNVSETPEPLPRPERFGSQ